MSSIIDSTKEHIAKLAPYAREVEVAVERAPDGAFISKIHVRSKNAILRAVKKAGSYRESLDRSYHAIVRQIHKLKDKKLKKRKVRMVFTEPHI